MTTTSKTALNKELVKAQALQSLEYFIRLIHPIRELGQCHTELINWWNRPEAKTHQLVLLPRDHGKSALAAYRVAWEITKNPAIRILYISSTAKLAIKQLKFIKDILTCDQYRYYWPEMVNADEAKREKWTETEIAVDHPERKRQIIRDPTIFTAGLTTNIVGMHCDISVLDDVVVDDTAYSEEGREKCADQVSYLASILGTNGRLWAVGTRYHPKDLYNELMNQIVKIFNENGELDHSYNLYEVWEKTVETRGDGTGDYLWPLLPGSKFGFNQSVLAQKRAQYANPTKFRAQYYNDPNDLSTSTITPSMFQYYNRSLLYQDKGRWTYKGKRLNVFAAIDFAYSLSKGADYTSIVVVGVDSGQNYYVLDIDRFKSNKISEYYDHIFRLYQKWNFRKLKAEVTAAQEVIVKDLKDNYIRTNGIALSVEEHRPTRMEGSKEERIEGILQPKYSNRQVYHFQGGHISALEEELVMQNPPHDDIKDALSNAVDAAIPPTSLASVFRDQEAKKDMYHKRFGGIH